jgi:hypothetical protein
VLKLTVLTVFMTLVFMINGKSLLWDGKFSALQIFTIQDSRSLNKNARHEKNPCQHSSTWLRGSKLPQRKRWCSGTAATTQLTPIPNPFNQRSPTAQLIKPINPPTSHNQPPATSPCSIPPQ